MIDELIKWERNCVEPKTEELRASCFKNTTFRGQNGTFSAISDSMPYKSG